ncbi:porin [Pseudomethylobacillus aquaticus]|uniref:Porin n=1 Tax=Pseudomethylobacillus aquaticus TaxID=2676064 RepID=A0A3N0UW36_9PROT|nr:porin [Pseudomethylobacillus aquaticus]ROH84464.1 porin [Pseudomethylobacillus aquaticus]
MKNLSLQPRWTTLAVMAALWTTSLPSQAATFQRDENQFINIGTAFRASFSSIEDGAPNGKSRSKDFELEEARLYTNGKVHEYVSFELNVARNSADNKVEILDGHVGLELNHYVNVWLGRFLPPASRASASAPAYPPTFDFPLVEQAPNRFGGRDDGATLWGATADQKLKYQVGAFKGREGGSNQSDNLSYAGRLQYNFWDAEPGFYNLASYDGAKSILSVGGSYRFQKDGAGTLVNPGDYRYWNLDGRLEKAVAGGGVVGAEASYYDYNNDDTADITAPQGKGYFVLGSYTFPQKVGIGKIQPKVVYQDFDNETTNINTKRYDLGASYLINGSNVRIDTFYFKQSQDQGLADINGVKVLFHVAHFF